MDALAKLGPGKLHQIKLDGKYSTDPEVARSFTVSGTITISAFAGLRARAEGGAGVEILDHDIKVGVGLDALAGVRGYVEATPSIGMREVGDPTARKTQFFIKGHLELAAQPFLGLSGDLFVELDSPWWSPAPDKKWTWPIGSLEYPLPGEFGIGADLDYVLGSPDLPEIKFGTPSFDSSKFITDLVNDHVPPKSKGEQEKPGTWKEGEEGKGEVPSGPGGPTEGGAAPAGAPTAAPAAGAGGRDESGQPAPKTGAPGTQPAAHPPGEGHEGVPTPGAEKHRAAGMQALGELARNAQRDPLNDQEITSALASLKERYGFKHLSARTDAGGANWEIDAELSPTVKVLVPKEESSSRVLSRNLEAEEDEERPDETAAHHIVAGNSPKANLSRVVLDKHSIGINSAANGVFLPRNTSSPPKMKGPLSKAAVHSTLHTDVYFAAVDARIGAAQASKSDVVEALDKIRADLLKNKFPK
jgi:hypothetical protein